MSGGQKFSVDLGQIQLTSEKLRSDTNEGLQPGLADANGKMQHGIRFGVRSPSGETEAAARALDEALRIHRGNTEAHLMRAQQLANALEIILANYRTSDELSRMDNEVIEWLIYNALPKQFTAEGPMFQ
ncbi:hypothetical protein [Catelliglobosispora koreensis]|uniref:hypothetical protein n=1 Tax=Catelliglobosispora koreensis TaxID=129052 RepID=UPI0003812994|nr:hypothetical protein [Catelliglobosispora koreensis]